MSKPLLHSSLTLMALIQAFAMLITVKTFLQKNEKGQSFKLELITTLSLSLLRAGLYGFGQSDYIFLAVQAIAIAAFAFYRYSRDLRKIIFYSLFYTAVLAFLDFVAAILPRTGQLMLMFAVRVLLLLAALVLHRKEFSEKQVSNAMALTGMFGIWSVIGLTSQEAVSVHDDVYFTWIIFFVIILGSSLVLRLRNQYELEKELVRLQEVEKELLQREYTVLNNAYSVNARMFHDFHNHIGVLRQLLASDGGQEKATLYLNELSEPMDAISKTVWTGDETVDYLINSKLAAAQSAQIHTEINVEFPSNSNIRAHDLCAILGNLLDNALEACQRMAGESEQFITLTIRRINNMLIIKVRNSASDAPRSGEKGLESTKADGGLHGWGIKSIAAAADKYDGVIQTEYDNHVFQSVVSLSFEGVAIKE